MVRVKTDPEFILGELNARWENSVDMVHHNHAHTTLLRQIIVTSSPTGLFWIIEENQRTQKKFKHSENMLRICTYNNLCLV